MGEMAEYYDERYDCGESNSERTDRMADEHGFAHTSIGYVPITARRGGIKYPARPDQPRDPGLPLVGSRIGNRTITHATLHHWPAQKDTTMALTPKQKLRKLESELDANLTLQQTLLKEESKLRDEIRKNDIPNQPPRDAGDMFKVEVQFTARGPHYTYLLMRNANRWYTTGTSEEQKRFDSWSALCGWLNSTHWHSQLKLLTETGLGFPTQRTLEPPF